MDKTERMRQIRQIRQIRYIREIKYISQRGVNRASSRARFVKHANATSTSRQRLGWVGVLTFMSTCRTRTCHVTPGFGVGGCVNVHVNLPCTHLLRHSLIHTGGVDAMWRLSKSAIPCSLATRVNTQVSPKLMRSIRVWQRHWMNSKAKHLLERSLQTRLSM